MSEKFNSFEGKQDGQMRGYVPAEWSYSIEEVARYRNRNRPLNALMGNRG